MIANILDNFNMIAAKQNQKFPFHFLSAPPTPPAEENKKGKEIFWFLHTRVRERVRGALVRFPTQSERTRQFQATTRSAREISRNQDLTQNTFELCPINPAKIWNLHWSLKGGRAEGATLMHSPQKILNLKGFSTLRVARRFP